MDSQKIKTLAERVSPMRKSTRKSSTASVKLPEVGNPTDFKHLLHIGTDSHHVDIASVPTQWQDILDIAKYCQDLDMSSNSSGDSETSKKEAREAPESPCEKIEEFEFESEIDLFGDIEQSLSEDYRKFLFG